jgi:hypothetical protein
MKKFISTLLICTMFFPVCAIAEPGDTDVLTSQETETVSPDAVEGLNTDNISTENEELLPAQTSSESRFKVPSGRKQLAVKFIIAMLCVAGCSLFLYLSLSVYNRLRDGFFADNAELPEGEEQLDAPQDLTEAVKTFVDKTHWHGV